MKVYAAFLSIEDLTYFLKKHGRGINTKDYEMYAALILGKLFSEFTNPLIGFPIKGNSRDKVIQGEQSVYHLLRRCLEEDNIYDIIIASSDDMRKKGYKLPYGETFQVKRIIIEKGESDAENAIVGYLNKQAERYGKSKEANLVLFFDCKDDFFRLDIKRIQHSFNSDSFPFGRIMFITKSADVIIVGEFWPNLGKREYLFKDIFEGMYL